MSWSLITFDVVSQAEPSPPQTRHLSSWFAVIQYSFPSWHVSVLHTYYHGMQIPHSIIDCLSQTSYHVCRNITIHISIERAALSLCLQHCSDQDYLSIAAKVSITANRHALPINADPPTLIVAGSSIHNLHMFPDRTTSCFIQNLTSTHYEVKNDMAFSIVEKRTFLAWR